MTDLPNNSSASKVLPYAPRDSRRRLDPLTIAAVTCVLLPPLLVASVNAHRSESIVLLAPVFALAAIVLGKVAHKRLHGTDARNSIATYAIRLGSAELLLALFFFGVLWLRPSSVASEHANRVKCASNMQLIGKAVEQYASANQGQFPSGLDVLLAGRHVDSETLTCPSSNHEMAYGATLEERVQKFRSNPNHCSVVYLGAGMTTQSVTPKLVIAYEFLQNHEREGVHVLYGDGKVKWWGKDDAAQIAADLRGGQNPPSVR